MAILIFKHFSAVGVFGYLDFDIKFNTDISFLVGGNGSGKTTALKLINALSNPSFKELLQIPFTSMSLVMGEDGREVTIFANENDGTIELGVSTINEKLALPSYSDIEFEYYSNHAEKLDELISDINRKFSDHEVVQEISNIQSPIFLGLERRREGGNRSKEDYFFEREMWMRTANKRAMAARRLIKGSLGVSLMETELLVQNSYKRLRELEDRQSNKLRDSILLSAFEYSSLKPESLKPDFRFWKEKSGLLERQREIKDALTKIGVKDSKLSVEVDSFFDELTELFEHLKESGEEFSLEWLLNKAQIDRMVKIVDIIDEHKNKVDELFKPINEFLETINDFYADSNKYIEIDPVGQLAVKRPNGKKCTIEGLSSGERQLLVIFAHAYFNKRERRNTVFIIDEPELSLHLRWQEKFAETIFKISPKSQFILATHSPEIVGVNKNKSVKCR